MADHLRHFGQGVLARLQGRFDDAGGRGLQGELLQKWADWLDSLRTEEEPDMLDVRAASKFMGLSEATLAQYRSWKRGPLPRIILKRVWYLKRDLEAWKVERAAQSRPKPESEPS